MSNLNWLQFAGWLTAEMTVIALAAAVAGACVKSARAQQAVWQAAVAAMALGLAVQLSGIHLRLPALPFRAEARHQYTVTASVAPAAAPAAVGKGLAARPESVATPRAAKWPGWLWLGGAFILLTYTLASRVGLWLRRRSAQPADAQAAGLIQEFHGALGLPAVRFEVWRQLRGPVAFGIFRPTIALPAQFAGQFSPAEIQAMLAHELAHLAARDPFWVLVGDLVAALAWWQPAVWWARRQLDMAAEEAADQASALTPDGPTTLAQCLVRLGRDLANQSASCAIGVAGNGSRSRLARRIERLLRQSDGWRPLPVWRRWTTLGIASALALATSALPIQPGLAGSLFAAFASAASAALDAGAAPAAPLAINPPSAATSSFAHSFGATSNTSQILLKFKLVSLKQNGDQGLGLDWVFGKSSTNNPALETSHDWGLMAVRAFNTNQHGAVLPATFTNYGIRTSSLTNTNNVTIDRLTTDGEFTVLSSNQFAALLAAIQAKTGSEILAAPSVATFSGEQARVQLSDVMAVVSGLRGEGPASSRAASNDYLIASLQTGIAVDTIPALEADGAWKLVIDASLTSFLGYEGTRNQAREGKVSDAKPLPATLPWPHFREIESLAQAKLSIGHTLAMRGPLWSETNKTKTKTALFSTSKTETNWQRLYVFVTAENPSPRAVQASAMPEPGGVVTSRGSESSGDLRVNASADIAVGVSVQDGEATVNLGEMHWNVAEGKLAPEHAITIHDGKVFLDGKEKANLPASAKTVDVESLRGAITITVDREKALEDQLESPAP